MRTAQVSELKDRLDEVIEAVKNGETVEIREGDTSLAEVVPHLTRARRVQTTPSDPPATRPDQIALYAHIDELVRQGKARRGTGKLPDDFFTRPRPKLEGGSVLEQLLRDREED
jgi:antitoxin (DNA-binding transcriptional repressor) of toxin-antitoxin stability system